MVTTYTKGWFRGVAVAAGMALPLAAAAQQAYTRDNLNLRAGPGTEYPVVVVLAARQPLDVMGCTAGYEWCDVLLPDGLRGWVIADFLDFPYQGAAVPLVNYGAVIGVPVVTFMIGSYWGNYYRDRPWYGEPRWWGGRPPPPPPPGWRPPPPPVPAWQPRPPPPGFRPSATFDGHSATPSERRPLPRPGMRPPPTFDGNPAPPSGVRPPPRPGGRPAPMFDGHPATPSEVRPPTPQGIRPSVPSEVRTPPPRGPRPPRDPGMRPPGGPGGMPR